MRITAEHVRELMESTDPDATLVLLQGRLDIVPAAEAGPSALVITSRADLLDRLGADGPHDLAAVAAGLDTEVTNLGG